MLATRQGAAAAHGFGGEHELSLALLVVNRRGERRRGARSAQASQPAALGL
jgi:hypothetical protein